MLRFPELIVVAVFAVHLCHALEDSCPANVGECKSDIAKGSAMMQNKRFVKTASTAVEEEDLLLENEPQGPALKTMSSQHDLGILKLWQDAAAARKPIVSNAVSTEATSSQESKSAGEKASQSVLEVGAGTSTRNWWQTGTPVPVPPGTGLSEIAPGGHQSSSKEGLQESIAEKLKETILDIEAMAKKDGKEIPAALKAVMAKVVKGQALTAQDLRVVEDTAATVPGFAEHLSAEAASMDHSLMTANDFATLDGGHRGEEEAEQASGLSTFQGDMVPANDEQLSLFERLANSTDEGQDLISQALLEDTEEDKKDQESGSRRRSGRRRSSARRRRSAWKKYLSEGGSLAAGESWPDGKVNYCFASDIDPAVKHIMEAANNQFSAASTKCLQFINVGHKSGRSNDQAKYQECKASPAIFIMSAEKGCYSYVGMVKSLKSQQLNMAPSGCVSIGTAIHELGHALGMAHEQSRADRDKYVTVNEGNIKSSEKHNFDVLKGTFAYGQYDFLSIMHYDAFAFAVNRNTPTITQKGGTQYKIGQRSGLSKYDVKHLGIMYHAQNSKCKSATGVSGIGCIDRPDTNGNDVCSGLKKCTAEVVPLCCACGGGYKVQCYKGKDCPQTPKLPPPSDDACVADVTSQYAGSGYDCVFNNACSGSIKVECPTGCTYEIAAGGPRVQQCDGKVDASICQGKCKISSR